MSKTAPASQQMAYFKLTFASSVNRDLMCTVCKELLKDPHHTSCCKSRCCRECIGRIQLIGNPCPKCSQRGFSVLQDEFDAKLKERVDGLMVFCPMQNYGCKWRGKLGVLDQHLKWGSSKTSPELCQLLSIQCTNGCGQFIPRGELPTHLRKSCAKRIVSCDHCGHEDMYEQMTSIHYSICHKFPIACSLGCNIRGITRSTIHEHQEKRCPQRLVSCNYKSIGCNVEFKFADGYRHMEEHARKHLSFVFNLCCTLQEENSKLKTTCASLEGECSTLHTNYDQLASSFKQLEAQVDSLRLSIPCPLPSAVASVPGPATGGGGERDKPRKISLPASLPSSIPEEVGEYLFMEAVNRPHRPLKSACSQPNISVNRGPRPPLLPKPMSYSNQNLARSYSPPAVYPRMKLVSTGSPSFVSPLPMSKYCNIFEEVTSAPPTTKTPPVQYNFQLSSSSSESVGEEVVQ